jgi:prepilin-type N-terminal cleavage/methylation domain-containing protein
VGGRFYVRGFLPRILNFVEAAICWFADDVSSRPNKELGEETRMIQRLQAKRNDEGFTLIELLIVIIVLGILAAIVVFAVGSTRKDAVQSSCKTDLKSVQLSAEAMNTKNGIYPATAPIQPGAGALLKAMPTSSDYALAYTQTGTPAGSSYTVTVDNLATPAVVETAADCSGL